MKLGGFKNYSLLSWFTNFKDVCTDKTEISSCGRACSDQKSAVTWARKQAPTAWPCLRSETRHERKRQQVFSNNMYSWSGSRDIVASCETSSGLFFFKALVHSLWQARFLPCLMLSGFVNPVLWSSIGWFFLKFLGWRESKKHGKERAPKSIDELSLRRHKLVFIYSQFHWERAIYSH